MMMSPDDAVARPRFHQSTFDKAPGPRSRAYFYDVDIQAANPHYHSTETVSHVWPVILRNVSGEAAVGFRTAKDEHCFVTA